MWSKWNWPMRDWGTSQDAPEVVWIIGASDGIGAALAQVWADKGAKLILSARNEQRLQELALSLPGDPVVVPLDVADTLSLAQAQVAIRPFGPVDRIINMAALYDPGRVKDLDPSKAAQIVTVNLTGSFNVAQTAAEVLRPGGQLALCGSVAGYFGLPQGQIYSATKAGVTNLAESLRVEMGGRMDVRLISPGFVDTRLTQKNAFEMPGLMPVDRAAQTIADQLDRNRFEIHFPRKLTLKLKLLRLLPYWLSLSLTRSLLR